MRERSWRWKGRLEARLRAERLQPPDSLVARLAAETGALRPTRLLSGRTALAAALTLAVASAVASVGGVGAAAAAAGSAAAAAARAATPPSSNARGNSNGTPSATAATTTTAPPVTKVKVCHATGSQTNPYVEIEVSQNGLNGHGGHTGDVIPAPPGGCPPGGTPGEDQYKPGKGCGDKNHVHFKQGQCKGI